MDVSHSQTINLYCLICSNFFEEEIWLIVDVNECPDLVEKIREENIHVTYCPDCGNKMKMDLPLLIYNHKKILRIIFSPQENLSDIKNQEILYSFLKALSENLKEKFNNEWIDKVPMIPKSILPSLFPRSWKTDKKSKTAHEEDNDFRITESEMLLLERLPEVKTMEGKYYFLRTHPYFTSEKTIKFLEEFVELSSIEGNQNNTESFRQDLELLKKCQSMGIDQAFQNLIG